MVPVILMRAAVRMQSLLRTYWRTVRMKTFLVSAVTSHVGLTCIGYNYSCVGAHAGTCA